MAKVMHFFSLEAAKHAVVESNTARDNYIGKFRYAVCYAIAHAIQYGNCSPLNDLYVGNNQTLIRDMVKKVNARDARCSNMLTAPANIFGFNKGSGYFMKSKKDDEGVAEAKAYFIPPIPEGMDVEQAEREVMDHLISIWDEKAEKVDRGGKEKAPLVITSYAKPKLQRLYKDIASKFPENNRLAHDIVLELGKLIAQLDNVVDVKAEPAVKQIEGKAEKPEPKKASKAA